MRPVQNGTDTQRLTEEHGLCAARRSPGVHVFMPLILVVIVSIVLVITARLQRRVGSSARRVYGMNRPRWPGEWMALGFPWRVMAACVLLLTGLATWGPPSAQTSRPLVYVVPIEGVIDLGLAPFLARTIRDAEQAGAAAVVLDINTSVDVSTRRS